MRVCCKGGALRPATVTGFEKFFPIGQRIMDGKCSNAAAA
jgi:hypothetical protein